MRRTVWKRIVVSCWMLGTILLMAFAAVTIRLHWVSEESIRAFEAHKTAFDQPSLSAAAQTTAHDAGDYPDVALWSSSRVRGYELARARVSAVPEGVLRTPSVGVRVPMLYGTNSTILAIGGAGRIEGTPPLGAQGNVGIAAHRDGHFCAACD